MKKIVLTFIGIWITFGVNSQEKIQTENGLKSDFVYKNGNIGIGTDSPSLNSDIEINKEENRILHLKILNSSSDNNAGSGIYVGSPISPSKGGRIAYYGDNFLYPFLANFTEVASFSYTNGLVLRTSAQNGIIKFITLNDKERMRITHDGNIGIGTTNPSGKLEILKNANLSNAITLPNSGLVIRADNDGNDASLRFGVDNANLKAVIQTEQTTTATKFDLLINPFGGNVGIGTKNSSSWKLAVNGKIRAKEIKVETGWSDFVFFEDYKLPTLQEVENHIKEKGHLKNIPSAKEVEENGIFLGEMNSKLLQKIEELTLYTIEQEKKIKFLEKQNIRIEKLEKENNYLKSFGERLRIIEEQLKKKN